MNPSRRVFLRAAPAALLAACGGVRPRIVLYCAQDREFALDLLEDFRQRSGLDVAPKFDTEANKSVGLYREIVAEKGRPRCDVFWNNEILSTIRLQSQGLLQEYRSDSAKNYPNWAKPKDGTWTAFASRARVLIINTKLVAEKDRPRSLLDLADARWRGRAVMAKPMFGTTATQMACLFDVLGAEKAQQYLADLKSNGVQLAPGNKQVAEWVARGRAPGGQPAVVGVTDTDDAIGELHAGGDVALVFPDRDAGGRMGTLFIPNTLCLLKECPNTEGARQLIDFLLSAEVERRLAEGPSAQIPLNPELRAELPPQIETPAKLKVMQVNWTNAALSWDEAQKFVTKLFAAG